MADADRFEALTTTIQAANFNKLIDRTPWNVCRNSSFEQWDGTDFYGWGFTDGGSDVLSQNAAIQHCWHGTKCAKVVKAITGTAQFYRDIDELSTLFVLKQEWWSAWAVVKGGHDADNVRLWLSQDGGSTKVYGDYAPGGSGHEIITVKKQFTGTPTGLRVGVEMTSGTYDLYIDCVSVNAGQMATPWMLCPWDYTGTNTLWAPQQPHVWVWNPHGADIAGITDSGTIAFTALDVPSLTSNWCKDNVQAVLFNIMIRDDVGVNGKLEMCEKGDSADATKLATNLINVANRDEFHQVYVGLDDGGEIEYKITSHNGTGGFDFSLYPMAYLKPF
jgi:hypothetical protein